MATASHEPVGSGLGGLDDPEEEDQLDLVSNEGDCFKVSRRVAGMSQLIQTMTSGGRHMPHSSAQ